MLGLAGTCREPPGDLTKPPGLLAAGAWREFLGEWQNPPGLVSPPCCIPCIVRPGESSKLPGLVRPVAAAATCNEPPEGEFVMPPGLEIPPAADSDAGEGSQELLLEWPSVTAAAFPEAACVSTGTDSALDRFPGNALLI